MKVHLKIVLTILAALLSGLAAFAQQRISGTITDSYGEAVIGAGIFQKGTDIGTVTDFDGKFVLTVDKGAEITVSAIGYKELTFTVDARTVYSFVLEDDALALEGVEIVAYGTQQKVSVTGALSSVKSENITRTPVSSINNVLAGQLSGVTTVQYSGEPGSDAATIFVRGSGTWSDSSPLIQVDGVERSMSDLNPEDIESITVLKDASATAVFGVRGANGVILVTTKRGSEGKVSINVNSSVSVLTPTEIVRQASSYDYAMFYNKMRRNDGVEDMFSPEVIQKFRDQSDPIRFPNTQWTDYMMKKATTQTNHGISISGGSDLVKYFVSAGYMSQGGLFEEFGEDYDFGYQYQRFNYRANLDLAVTKTTKISFDVSGLVSDADKPRTGQGSSGMIRNILQSTPFSSPGLVNGRFVTTSTDYSDGLILPFTGTHGLGYYVDQPGYISTNINKLQMDLALNQDLSFITKGLSFKVKGSYNSQFTVSQTGTKGIATYEPVIQSDGSLKYRKNGENTPMGYSDSSGKARNWYFETSFNYGRTFGSHSVGGLVLYNQSKEYYPSTYSDIPRGYVGLVGRVTYDYKKRYLAEVNLGYNGSENFHPDRRFGLFPAGSLGWVVSDEPFFRPLKSVFSFFKLRASWGLVGNDKIGGSRFMYLADPYTVNSSSLATRSGYAYNFGVDNSTNFMGSYENSRNNPNVSWEKAFKQNYGVDINFLNEKLSSSFDYYKEHRTGILLRDMAAPGIIGFAVPYANLGIVDSWGWEVSLKWNDRINSNFNYWANLNLSHNQNVIVEKKEEPYTNEYQYERGNRIGSRYMYQFFRFYDADTPRLYEETFGQPFPKQLTEQLKDGDAVFVDLDGNGVINGDDKTRGLGYTDDPQYVLGFNAGFSYKKFELNMQWTGAWGVSRMLGDTFRIPFTSRTDYATGGLLQYHVDNTWDSEHPSQNAEYPRATWDNGITNNYQDCALYEKDASYLRLKTLQIAYNFSSPLLARIGVRHLQLAFSGYNLLTFTPYIWGDPETAASSEPTYPLQRTYTMSLKFNF